MTVYQVLIQASTRIDFSSKLTHCKSKRAHTCRGLLMRCKLLEGTASEPAPSKLLGLACKAVSYASLSVVGVS